MTDKCMTKPIVTDEEIDEFALKAQLDGVKIPNKYVHDAIALVRRRLAERLRTHDWPNDFFTVEARELFDEEKAALVQKLLGYCIGDKAARIVESDE